MKYIYKARFIGRLNYSIGETSEIKKAFVFDKPQDFEGIKKEIYKTFEHVRIIRIIDLSKAGYVQEIKEIVCE